MATGAELDAGGSTEITASDYRQLVGRVQDWVRFTVPAAATTVVVSRGDDELMQLGGRPAWHFPRLPDGRYAGEYPADSAEAISQLEELRAQGAGYLVLPNTAFWWLDFYDDLRRHLEGHCETVVSNHDCRIYRLLEEGTYAADRALVSVAHVPGITGTDGRILSNFLDSLLPLGTRSAVLTAETVPLPSGADAWQPTRAAVADAQAADRELAALAARGVEFLVIPRATFEWLAAHPPLGEAAHRSHRLVTHQHYICEIYELIAAPESPPSPAPAESHVAPEQPQRHRSLFERLGLRAGQFDER